VGIPYPYEGVRTPPNGTGPLRDRSETFPLRRGPYPPLRPPPTGQVHDIIINNFEIRTVGSSLLTSVFGWLGDWDANRCRVIRTNVAPTLLTAEPRVSLLSSPLVALVCLRGGVCLL